MTALPRLIALLIVLLLALVACGPSASAPAAAPAKPAAQAPAQPPAAQSKPAQPAAPAQAEPAGAKWQQDWDALLAAARREGKVAIAGAPGNDYRAAVLEFQNKYPGIQVEYQGLSARDMQTRFNQERRADQYLWDVIINGPTTFDITAKKEGGFESLRAALVLPEVLDESVWLGGFDKAFLDSEKQYVFSFQAEVSGQVFVNRDVVPESELNTIQGLLDPKWKGRMAFDDPRFDGAGSGRVAAWIGILGEDFARRLLAQDIVLTRDQRQLAEWVVRGRYPFGMGIGTGDLIHFQQEGLGKNVETLGGLVPEAWRLSSGFGVVRLVSRAPNPNAAKVFVNWLLSQDGQNAWVSKAARASRRLDVPRIAGLSPEVGIDYFDIDREERLPLRERAKEIATEVIR
jgi:iron(III) transport system substrate-binding protein